MSQPAPTARLLLTVLRRFEVDLQRRLHEDGFTDVSVAQTNVLRHLNPEGMRLSALAADAGISKQAGSQAVKMLVARDLVRIEPDPADARAKRVIYAERGRALVARAIVHVMAIEREWAERLGEDAYVALRRDLSVLSTGNESVSGSTGFSGI